MERPTIYFQPILVSDDGTNLQYDVPSELRDWDVFLTREDAEIWCEDNGYQNCLIEVYKDNDIEGIRVLNADGDVLAVFEEE